nr:MAG TPA: hypothetical protein [Bacteriophage sp.]
MFLSPLTASYRLSLVEKTRKKYANINCRIFR